VSKPRETARQIAEQIFGTADCYERDRERATAAIEAHVASFTADLAQAKSLEALQRARADRLEADLVQAQQALASMTASAVHWKRVAESR